MSPCAAVILDVGRGSRRLNSHESRPRALYTGPDGKPLLDWINASLRHAQVNRRIYVGGYQIQEVLKQYPHLDYWYCHNGSFNNELKALAAIDIPQNHDLLIIRGDTLVTPASITRMIAADGQIRAGYYHTAEGDSFCGVLYVKADCIDTFLQTAAELETREHATRLDAVLPGINTSRLDLSGQAAPISDQAAVMNTVFKGKAVTLEQLGHLPSSMVILDQLTFSASEWAHEKRL